MPAEIEYVIDTKTGEMQVTIHGIEGPACDDIRRLAAQLLGEPTVDRKTADYEREPRVERRLKA